MREIKFKVWDNQAKKWCGYEDVGYVMDLQYSVECNGFMIDNDSIDFPRDVTLCQFTGLKDKNEKEIYEGDIVQIDNAFGKIIGAYEVRWLEGKHGFDFWGFNKIAFGVANSCIFEVIGNIYENLDLLKHD